jgi:hypothetical protein
MTPPRWHRYALIAPFAAFFLILVIGGLANRVDARGQFIDDTTGLGVPGASVTFGSRSTSTDGDGRYAMDNLPRGSSLLIQHRYYGRNSVAADAAVLRITPLTLTLEVKDSATGKGVDTPEARQPADTQVGKGVSSGEMVVAPYPKRDIPLLVCANNYKPLEITPKGNLQDVELTFAAGQSCPPLKTPAPTPTPSTTPAPTGSAAPSPSSGGSPSPTPKPSGP